MYKDIRLTKVTKKYVFYIINIFLKKVRSYQLVKKFFQICSNEIIGFTLNVTIEINLKDILHIPNYTILRIIYVEYNYCTKLIRAQNTDNKRKSLRW